MSEATKHVSATASQPQTAEPRCGPMPYLVVALGWVLLAVFALTFRVASPLWVPVFDWVFSQAVLTEQLFPNITRWQTYSMWAAGYASVALIAWVIVEKPRARSRRYLWRRAFVAWLVIQLLYSITAFFLVSRGVIAE